MLKLTPARLVVLGALLLTLVISGSASAAKKVEATLRVVTHEGKVLADKTLKTGTTSVPTSKRAKCFGSGSTNGARKLQGATALGLLADAARTTPSLRPLLVTNASDLGLGVCGIGGEVARGEEWWNLNVNHKSSTVGGELAKVKGGDVVLWYLAPDFDTPTPDELFLQAPEKAVKNEPFKVKVLKYTSRGKRSPASGVKVTGAEAPTNSAGVATITLKKTSKLIARSGDLIPSNREIVCVGAKCK